MFKLVKTGIILNLVFAGSSGIIFSNNDNKFDYSDIRDDFEGSNINIGNITLNEKVQFIDFSEYSFNTSNYSLYFYAYIPYKIVNNSTLNKIHIAFGNSSNFQKYRIKILDQENNIYKFKLILNDINYQYILSCFNEGEREYKIPGFEVVIEGSQNATEYQIGGHYTYSGYALGCSNESINQSTLKRKYEDLETLSFDIHDTYYRFDGHYEKWIYQAQQIDSVYFSIPNYYLEKYGSVSSIKAEYYEFKTSPIIVLRNDVYNLFKDFIGKKISDSYNPGYNLVAPNFYVYSKNYEEGYLDPGYNFRKKQWTNYLPILFNSGQSNDKEISRSELKNYFYSYNKSYYYGKNYKGLSMDLFQGEIDDGHKEGYNLIEINSSDNENLLIYENKGFWNNFWNELFGNKFESIEFKLFEKVEEITDPKTMLINDKDFEKFSTYYSNANKNDESTYLFRFSNSTYFNEKVYDMKYGDLMAAGVDGYVAQETVYLDFDIISLTFNRNGSYTIIPVVANPIDIFSDVTPPNIDSIDFLAIIKIILGIILIIFIIWILKLTFNVLGISLKDIFDFLFVKPFKWIKSKFKSRKKDKKVKKYNVIYNYHKKHPSIYLKEDNEKFDNLVVTHKPNNKNKFIKLKDNINKDDTSESYVSKNIYHTDLKYKGRKMKNRKLSKRDKKMIKKRIIKKDGK